MAAQHPDVLLAWQADAGVSAVGPNMPLGGLPDGPDAQDPLDHRHKLALRLIDQIDGAIEFVHRGVAQARVPASK